MPTLADCAAARAARRDPDSSSALAWRKAQGWVDANVLDFLDREALNTTHCGGGGLASAQGVSRNY